MALTALAKPAIEPSRGPRHIPPPYKLSTQFSVLSSSSPSTMAPVKVSKICCSTSCTRCMRMHSTVTHAVATLQLVRDT